MDLPGPWQDEQVKCHRDPAICPPTIVFLGRINWKKGLDLLIPAMAHTPGARLIVAGNDEECYQLKLESLARECGVSSRVSFIGPVHNEAKWQLLRSADVFALTSYSENFGNAVLEAMACGVPVVVTAGVGLASTVAAHDAGRVVEGTPAAIGEAIRNLLHDREARRRLGANGRRIVAERFSWEGVAREMSHLYAELVLSDTSKARSTALTLAATEPERRK
jgi:glycosyltransferase involved in cell wall biosynthesis